MNICSPNAKTFCNECILQVSTDMKIGIGIRYIVEVTADDKWVGAGIQLSSDSVCLITSQAQCIL